VSSIDVPLGLAVSCRVTAPCRPYFGLFLEEVFLECQRFVNHVLERQFAPVFNDQLESPYIENSAERTAERTGFDSRGKRDRSWWLQFLVFKEIRQLLKASKREALLLIWPCWPGCLSSTETQSNIDQEMMAAYLANRGLTRSFFRSETAS